ncbi:uncharacterized protein LOC129595527 [Paramacrobiotus metropolitanus]|uniref:uncharacterized protein LOC129595527 n=1 Tax=Paramacrobiotus metropolitanus TaxID=2943436 RepID=UPI00244564A5|nr:uncharacterized protein LOC129595527 [Paramacrobiotus metropolitanus]
MHTATTDNQMNSNQVIVQRGTAAATASSQKIDDGTRSFLFLTLLTFSVMVIRVAAVVDPQNAQATEGQIDLDVQQSPSLDNSNHQSLATGQSSVAGTSISFNSNTNTALQFDPALPANPVISGSNSANSHGNGVTGVIQNNDQSHSNSTNDGQHHSVVGQSHITAMARDCI